MYNISYSVASTLLILVFIGSYFGNKKMRFKQDKIYGYALISSFVAVLFDSTAVILENSQINSGLLIVLLYIANILFMIGMHTFLVLLVFYFLTLTKIKLKNWQIFLTCIPYLLVVLLSLLSPLTDYAIFRISPQAIYEKSFMHPMLYISTLFYLTVYFVIIINKRHVIRKLIVFSLITTIVVAIGTAIIQIYYPAYLLTASATAIGAVLLFYVLQLPSKNVDFQTNYYNKLSLESLLEDDYSHKFDKQIIMITINSLTQIGQNYGVDIEDQIINNITNHLNTVFKDYRICRIYYPIFLVFVEDKKYSSKDINKIYEDFPKDSVHDNINIQYNINFTVFEENNLSNPLQLSNMIEFLINDKINTSIDIVEINGEIINNYHKFLNLEKQLNELICNDKISIHMKNIYDKDEKIIAYEAYPVVSSDEFSFVDDNTLKNAAIRGNLLSELIDIIFEKVNRYLYDERVKKNYPEIMINIPWEFFKNKKADEIIKNSFDKDCRQQIIFSFYEKQVSSIPENVFEAIQRLNQEGYKIIFDDFGIGYTSSGVLLNLNLFGVRINYNKLETLMGSSERLAYIMLVNNIVKEVDIKLICQGFNTPEEKKRIKELGVKYFQD